MKKIIYFILLASLSIIMITGCSKDESMVENSTATVKSKILGKWKLDSEVTKTIRPSLPVEVITKPGI
ncbi:hypothetical protein C8J95_11276 [Elizabethkingia sp. YR214]|nr:hypothetical protein C8J95_11276 [Elizabethkingia sp. YR214]